MCRIQTKAIPLLCKIKSISDLSAFNVWSLLSDFSLILLDFHIMTFDKCFLITDQVDIKMQGWQVYTRHNVHVKYPNEPKELKYFYFLNY